MVRTKMNNTAKRNACPQGIVVQGHGPDSYFGFSTADARRLYTGHGHAHFDSVTSRHEALYFDDAKFVFPGFFNPPSNDQSYG